MIFYRLQDSTTETSKLAEKNYYPKYYHYQSDASAANETRRNLDDAIWIIWKLASKVYFLCPFYIHFYNKMVTIWTLFLKKCWGYFEKANGNKYYEILPYLSFDAPLNRGSELRI